LCAGGQRAARWSSRALIFDVLDQGEQCPAKATATRIHDQKSKLPSASAGSPGARALYDRRRPSPSELPERRTRRSPTAPTDTERALSDATDQADAANRAKSPSRDGLA